MSETMELLYREHADMAKLLSILDREITALDQGGVEGAGAFLASLRSAMDEATTRDIVPR